MRKTPLILMAAALPMAVNAANTEFSYGGYIKFDAIYSQYSDGDAGTGLGRDFYVPSATPASAGSGEESTKFDMHAKTSRFNFTTNTDFGDGVKVKSFVELDFLGSAQGNEVVSNSYSPRLRHAFLQSGNLLVGQTWSTFMNVGALPETVDFLGVSDGTVFNRQAQVRYTMGNIQLSVENPESTVGGITDDSGMPDLVARYNMKAGKHSFSVAAIARQLATYSEAVADDPGTVDDETAAEVDESTMGFGLSVSGKIMVGKDDLKFSVTSGQVARYVGLAAAADGYLNADGEIEATDVTAAFVAYRHHWSDKLRSTLAYSMLQADYGVDNTADTDSTSSVRVNLMYSPVPKLSYGVELTQANHKADTAVDVEGDLTRLHFTTKYAF